MFFQRLGLSVTSINHEYRQRSISSDLLILPGVGSFDQAITAISKSPIQELLQSQIRKDLPLIGICLGFQLLCASSTESCMQQTDTIDGLGVFDNYNMIDLSSLNLKINVGPKMLIANHDDPSIRLPSEPLYFMHRYACPIDNSIHPKSLHSYVIHQNIKITASCRHGNAWGFQFHPEKSGVGGHKLLTSILSLF